jgi:hypothetical protein
MQRDTGYPDLFCALVGLPIVLICGVIAVSIALSIGSASRGHAMASAAPVSERWGEFQWLSPWLEGGGSFREPRDGEFVLSSASFGGRWTGWASLERNQNTTRVEAQIAIGTRSLISRPLRYAPLSTVERKSDASLVDAFAGVAGPWGRFRLGLIPITFGLEDAVESERRWLRPLVLRRGLIGLRDIGIGYSVSAGGFHSDWFVHNGEAGDDRDREMWMTARWEYRMRSARSLWRWGASGQVGRTSVESTHPTGTTPSSILELDPDQSSRLRFGGLHMASTWIIGGGERGSESDRRFGFEFEGFGGEILQDARSRRLRALRIDLEYEPFIRWGFLLRGEALDPDTQVSGDLVHEASVGVMHYVLPGALKRSLRALLVGTKEWSEATVAGFTEPRHRVEFVLRFSPDLPE